MSTVEITRVEDVREGDVVTLTRNGTTVVGTVRDVAHGHVTHLEIATLPCSLIAGDGYWTFVSATREVPDLPTKPGSFIIASGVGYQRLRLDGEPFADVTLRRAAVGPEWGGYTDDGRYIEVNSDCITTWTPAKVVPEGGAS